MYLAYVLAEHITMVSQTLPEWCGFYANRENNPFKPKSFLSSFSFSSRFLSFINGNLTQLNDVTKIVDQIEKMVIVRSQWNATRRNLAVIDEAVYALAKTRNASSHCPTAGRISRLYEVPWHNKWKAPLGRMLARHYYRERRIAEGSKNGVFIVNHYNKNLRTIETWMTAILLLVMNVYNDCLFVREQENMMKVNNSLLVAHCGGQFKK